MPEHILAKDGNFLYRCRHDALLYPGPPHTSEGEPPPPPPPPPISPRVLVWGDFENNGIGVRKIAVWTGDTWDFPGGIDPGIDVPVEAAGEINTWFLLSLRTTFNVFTLMSIDPFGVQTTIYAHDTRGFATRSPQISRSSVFPESLLVYQEEYVGPTGVRRILYLWTPTPPSIGGGFIPLPKVVDDYELWRGDHIAVWRNRIWSYFYRSDTPVFVRLYSMGPDMVWRFERQLDYDADYSDMGVFNDNLVMTSSPSGYPKVELYDGSTLTDITFDLGVRFGGVPHNIVEFDGHIVLVGDKVDNNPAKHILVFDGVSSWGFYDPEHPEILPYNCRMNADTEYLYAGFSNFGGGSEDVIRRAPIGGGFEAFPILLGPLPNIGVVRGIETLEG